jgi:hypothetical protein
VLPDKIQHSKLSLKNRNHLLKPPTIIKQWDESQPFIIPEKKRRPFFYSKVAEWWLTVGMNFGKL